MAIYVAIAFLSLVVTYEKDYAMKKSYLGLSSLCCSLILAACGGGGGGNDAPPPPVSLKIKAVDDNLSISVGKTANILLNDTLDEKLISASDISITLINSTAPASITINSQGIVNVASSTPVGTYNMTYQICEKAKNSNCATANASLTITPELAASVAEAFTKLEQSGAIPVLNTDNTILGTDSNNNGVRDDVENYIQSLPDTSAQKSALTQTSSAISQAMVVDTANQTSVIAATNKTAAAIKCIYASYNDAEEASNKVADMRKLTVNTTERIAAYENFNISASGTSSVLPQGDGCENK